MTRPTPSPADLPPAEERLRALLVGILQIVDNLREGLQGLTDTLAQKPSQPQPPAAPPPRRLPAEDPAQPYQRGEDLQRQKEYEQAIAQYTEALRIDPRYSKAYLKRGQIHRLRGEAELALRDFTAVLEIEPREVEALLQRADTLLAGNRLDEAIADYRLCLRFRPTSVWARSRLASVYQRQTQYEDALAQWTEIIRLRPTDATAVFRRGMVFLTCSRFQQAVGDFTRTLELNPQHAEAGERRIEAHKSLLASRRKSAERVPAAQTKTEKAAPAAETVEARSEHIRVVCPECRTCGEVRWDRLTYVLTCRGCARHFRVNADGQMSEVVKDKEGRWLTRLLPKGNAARQKGSRRWAGRLLLAAGLLLGVALAGGFWLRETPPPREPELPAELQPRAELLTRAWLKKDLFLMRRLTATTHDRVLNSWFARHAPGIREVPEDLPLDVRIQQTKGNQASVIVKVAGMPGKPIEFRQQWEERGNTWYFLPPSR
jgi:tetratricopeptide (TPR) repeat protein